MWSLFVSIHPRAAARSMCSARRVNKHQSALAKRRMLSAKLNLGNADPVAPALAARGVRCMPGCRGVKQATGVLPPPPAWLRPPPSERKSISGLREVGRYQAAAVTPRSSFCPPNCLSSLPSSSAFSALGLFFFSFFCIIIFAWDFSLC